MTKSPIITFAIIAGFSLAIGAPAFAKKPDSPGNSDTQDSSQGNQAGAHSPDGAQDSKVYFTQDRRNTIRNYYAKSPQPGNCPPGLAKKNNGCQPPGQAKKWRRGEPLPQDLVYYDLPGDLIEQLGHTPEGDRIVQVDSDLLLINIATGLVIDAISVQE